MEKDSLNYSLSGEDILRALDGKCNLIQYKNIQRYKTIDELLGKYNKCVILYNTTENYGHFTCVYKYNGTIYFFDSYGIIPDDELKWQKCYGKDCLAPTRYLTKLFYNSKHPIEYNEYPLQEKASGITTCGRWVINRLKYPEISVDDYYKIFKDASRYMNIDKLICKLVPLE
tara:strand:+ start:177 stop:692 length:516 start_codon:yes stop_codon:yes gene_type:complete